MPSGVTDVQGITGGGSRQGSMGRLLLGARGSNDAHLTASKHGGRLLQQPCLRSPEGLASPATKALRDVFHHKTSKSLGKARHFSCKS